MALHNIPLPDILLPLTIIIVSGGGLALMAGFRIREMALCLAGLTILINVGVHDFWNTYPKLNTQHEVQNFVKTWGSLLAYWCSLAPRGFLNSDYLNANN